MRRLSFRKFKSFLFQLYEENIYKQQTEISFFRWFLNDFQIIFKYFEMTFK